VSQVPKTARASWSVFLEVFLRGDASISERGRLTECLYTTVEFLRGDASVSERRRLTLCLYTTSA